MFRVRLLVVTALGEQPDAAFAGLPRVGRRRRDPRTFQQQALTDAVSRYRDLARLDPGHDFGGDRKAGEDDVRAVRVEAGDGGAFRT